MSENYNWKFELEEYVKQGEPDKIEKSKAWQTAIGLQAVDGLETSEYLLETAKEQLLSEKAFQFSPAAWQIHPFCEGNTRATAVFIIKYLKTFGFDISNDVFAEKSWYFRNALVRANYNDLQKGVYATIAYLERFFENLLLGKHHALKNRYLHLDYKEKPKQEPAYSAK